MTAITCHQCAEAVRVYAPGAPEERALVTCPDQAAEVLSPLLAGRDREACVTAYLDTKHRVIAAELLSLGSIDHTFISPRELLRGALLRNAAAVVVAHNHASGDAEPSRDDEAVTRRLATAAEIVGVELLDHLVVGHAGRWVSLARRGRI